MRHHHLARGARLLASAAVGAALVVAQLVPGTASAVPSTVPPVLQPSSAVVTADALPTVQVDGVVWAQVMIGNTVYAAGDFTTARPAGADPGESTTPRSNLLAYSITTGKLNTTFKPKKLNGQIKTIAVSADHKTVFVGGDFTRVGTATRNRFAAFDAKSGALRKANPSFNSRVNAVTVVGKNVYVGGWFTRVGTKLRSRLAAVNGSTGKLTSWAPVASEGVNALVATPDKTKIIAGGIFTTINSRAAYGMGAIGVKTAQTKTWKVNKVVRDAGQDSAILSLAVDGDTVYGTGYAYGGGNFEGTFAANPKDGSIRWLQDCHGDTYSVAPVGNTVYTVGHAHYCANIGGFPDTSPRTRWQRALAVTKAAKGTVAENGQTSSKWHYGNFAGQPAPALYNWFPDLTVGSYTKQYQAAWSIVGNASYVSAGGEFVAANGTPQQGLVRFAVATKVSARAEGPQLEDSSTAPEPTADADGGVRVSWLTNSDPDDRTLTYQVLRDVAVVSPTMKQAATFWNRQTMAWTDLGATPGLTYRYSIRATDPEGNTVTSPQTSITVPSESPSTGSGTDPTPDPAPSAGSATVEPPAGG